MRFLNTRFYSLITLLTIACLSSIGTKTYAHNLKVAYFDIGQSTFGDYYLKVSFDRQDIVDILQKEFRHLVKDGYDVNEMNDCVIEYLYKHLELTFNQQQTGWIFIDFEANKDYFKYLFYLKTKVPKVKEIQVKNDCFIQDLDKHRNLIRIDLNGRDRLFQLSRKRKKTTVSY
ncbi:MAG TPA: hypothetical protein DCS93_37970 [Microscillaceae bacterium]|nr:hypothetical protein [Microscillaceae bacterium]